MTKAPQKEQQTMNDYEKAFQLKDPKYRSSILTNGLNKSGERALL